MLIVGKGVGRGRSSDSVTPDAASLSITGYAPTITATNNIVASPGAATLTLTGYAPSIVNYTTLLLNHFNGSDGATTFTDEIVGITWSSDPGSGGISELDTANKKFGSASWKGTANTSSPQDLKGRALGTGFTWPSGSFTLEGFLAIADADGGVQIGTDQNDDVFPNTSIQLSLIRGGASNGWTAFWATPTDSYFESNTSYGLTDNAFYHFAIVRDADADTWSVFFDGNRVAHHSDSAALTNTPSRIYTAGWLATGVGSTQGGWVDEVRLTDGVVYSGTTYTVPTAEFS